MSNLTEISQTLNKQIEDLQQKIKQTMQLKKQEKNQAIIKNQRQVKRARNLLKTYEFEIQSKNDSNDIKGHEQKLKKYAKQLDGFDQTLQYSRNEGINENDLFKYRKEQKPEDLNNKGVLIQKAHNTQAEGTNILKGILKDGHQMKSQANQINIELNRQIQQLDTIYDNLNDTQTTLKRAEKHLRYFARQLYTDRLMICLIVMIVIAIIVIIILSAMGKLPNSSSDKLK